LCILPYEQYDLAVSQFLKLNLPNYLYLAMGS
jgi:hypothetical protein